MHDAHKTTVSLKTTNAAGNMTRDIACAFREEARVPTDATVYCARFRIHIDRNGRICQQCGTSGAFRLALLTHAMRLGRQGMICCHRGKHLREEALGCCGGMNVGIHACTIHGETPSRGCGACNDFALSDKADL